MSQRALAAETHAAYTTARLDLVELVPENVRRVLDIGCSDGTFGAAIKTRNNLTSVVGIECEMTLAGAARTRLDAVYVGDVEDFDWKQFSAMEPFDCLICGDVLEHLRSPMSVLREASRYLSASGVLVISLPNIRHVSALWSIAASGRFPQRDRGIFDRTHLRWFTIGDARDLMCRAGFEITAETFNLRVGDRGGGQLNRMLGRMPKSLAGLFLIREFLTYQYSFRAERIGRRLSASG